MSAAKTWQTLVAGLILLAAAVLVMTFWVRPPSFDQAFWTAMVAIGVHKTMTSIVGLLRWDGAP